MVVLACFVRLRLFGCWSLPLLVTLTFPHATTTAAAAAATATTTVTAVAAVAAVAFLPAMSAMTAMSEQVHPNEHRSDKYPEPVLNYPLHDEIPLSVE